MEQDHNHQTITLLAGFTDPSQAQACAADLETHGVPAAVLLPRADGQESPAPDETTPTESALGGGVAMGATLGATAGLLAASYLVPGVGELVGSASLVTTLAGAGIGSFLGGLYTQGADGNREGGAVKAVVLVRVNPDEEAEVRRMVERWKPANISFA